MNAATPAQAGFTLLEMLVALVIFGLLMAGVGQTLSFGLTAWSAETRTAAGSEDLASVDGALRRLLEQAAPGGFAGQSDALAFATSLPAGSGVADRLADVALMVAPGQKLVLRWVPHPAGIALRPPAVPRNEILVGGVTAIHLQYLTPQRHAAAAWSDHWTQHGLPLLVRINIQFAGGKIWPDLVAAPFANIT